LVKNCAVGIVRDKNRKVMAFATVINGLAPKTAVIDLMCRSPIADNGAMEFLFSEIWRWLRERNWRYLDLGGAPREGVVLEKLSFKKIRKVLPKKLVSFTVWKEAVLKLPSLLLHLSPQKIVGWPEFTDCGNLRRNFGRFGNGGLLSTAILWMLFISFGASLSCEGKSKNFLPQENQRILLFVLTTRNFLPKNDKI